MPKVQPIVKVVEITAANPPAGKSDQPTDEIRRWTPDDAIPPPEDLDQLAKLTGVNRVRRSCIAAITLNTVGLGYTLELAEGEEQREDVDEQVKACTARLEACARQDRRLKRPSLTRLLEAVKWDEQEVGNGYIEVSRQKLDGQIDGLFHGRGKRVRRLQSRDGWVIGPRHGSGADRVRFHDFGEKVQYDGDGTPQDRLVRSGSQGGRWSKNELLPFQLYTSESEEYGLPPDVALAWDYLGDKNAAQANAGFFDGSAVPPTIVYVQGEETSGDDEAGTVRLEVSAATAAAVADTLRADTGPNRRVAIIPLPPGAEMGSIDLSQRADRDIGFVSYRSDNRRAVLGAYRLSPIFVADIEDAGKYTAQVERAITKEQVFDPDQRRWTELMQPIIDDLGYPFLRFKFKELAIQEDQAKRESADGLAQFGEITRGELREAHDFPPLPEAAEDSDPESGQVPFGWNAELVPPQTPAAPLTTEPALPPEGDPLAKAAGDAFEEAVASAISEVGRLAGDAYTIAPVIVEADGNKVTIRPGSSNGNG